MENKKDKLYGKTMYFYKHTIGTEKSVSEMKEILLHLVWFCGNLLSTERRGVIFINEKKMKSLHMYSKLKL